MQTYLKNWEKVTWWSMGGEGKSYLGDQNRTGEPVLFVGSWEIPQDLLGTLCWERGESAGTQYCRGSGWCEHSEALLLPRCSLCSGCFAVLTSSCLQFNSPAICTTFHLFSGLILRNVQSQPQLFIINFPVVCSFHPQLCTVPSSCVQLPSSLFTIFIPLWASGKACPRVVLTTRLITISL